MEAQQIMPFIKIKLEKNDFKKLSDLKRENQEIMKKYIANKKMIKEILKKF